jgi:ArsR family metal-binding transcriptional regulator
MLILNYDLEVSTPPCTPGAERFAAHARLGVEISEALPYLNATLRGAVYDHAARALTWKKGGHTIAFRPFEIATSNVEDRDSAREEIESLIAMVNRTWEGRGDIRPDFETHQRPGVLAVYKLLPGGNCKACGESTCFNFAIKLVASHETIASCPLLFEQEQAERLAALRSLLIEAPAIG